MTTAPQDLLPPMGSDTTVISYCNALASLRSEVNKQLHKLVSEHEAEIVSALEFGNEVTADVAHAKTLLTSATTHVNEITDKYKASKQELHSLLEPIINKIVEEENASRPSTSKNSHFESNATRDTFPQPDFGSPEIVDSTTLRRREILQKARELILKDDHETVDVEIPPQSFNSNQRSGLANAPALPIAFAFPRCKCRKTAVVMMNMAHELMLEATKAELSVAESLYNCVRDMLDMFRAVSPAAHGVKFETTILGVLMYNDCMYIAHQLMLLAHCYKSSLPEPLNKKATFVDLVTPFRQLGERYFFQQLRRQRQELQESISQINGVADTHLPARYKAVEIGLRQILHRMKHLRLWKDVLPKEVFYRAVGSMIENPVVIFLTTSTQEMKDISEEETHRLHFLFKTLFELENMFEGVFIGDYVPSWSKFKKLTELLEMPMVQIVERFNAGELKEFSISEIKKLIIALFTDSDKRKECLKRLNPQ